MRRPPEYKTVMIAVRVTPAKKRYLEDHYGSMLPKLINSYLDKMVSHAVTGFKPEHIEILKPLIQD